MISEIIGTGNVVLVYDHLISTRLSAMDLRLWVDVRYSSGITNFNSQRSDNFAFNSYFKKLHFPYVWISQIVSSYKHQHTYSIVKGRTQAEDKSHDILRQFLRRQEFYEIFSYFRKFLPWLRQFFMNFHNLCAT